MSEFDDLTFDAFFAKLSGHGASHRWQRELAGPGYCGNRMVRIPTGFGKTLGVLATWLWHRVHRQNGDWPRRLVWCLPMRVLVEQTEQEVKSALERLGLLWDTPGEHEGKVGVHLLMGGADAGDWHLYPECDAVLVGTQDMLLSRTLNRGYASPRARWPMEFGLLNQDALWVMDEVQLMDVGLATSGQVQVFRNEDSAAGKFYRPCFTWWMSATLQRTWLEKSPDTTNLVTELARNTHRIAPEDRSGHLWDDVKKPLKLTPIGTAKQLAKIVIERHRESRCGSAGPTLVVLNTVKRAVEVWKALRSDRALGQLRTDLRLVHSRFRPAERTGWPREFLNREACEPNTNRIVVATQVIEAGVDISAALLITELAPWASLVQRFGRCARWGGIAEVVVADFEHDTDVKAAPYAVEELNAAREACQILSDVASLHLERFESDHKDMLPRLYPYELAHLLLRHELDELFDTSPDLSGADIDISRFIRSGNERDVQVFWATVNVSSVPPASLKPTRNELCSIPFLEAQEWLCAPKSERLKPKLRAWVWDWLDREWRLPARRDIHPGQTVLVECGVGGYRRDAGWDPRSTVSVEPLDPDEIEYTSRPCWTRDGDGWRPGERRVRKLPHGDQADAAEDDESLSIANGWQTIADHGLHVAAEVERIGKQLSPDLTSLLHLAGRWHDLGKAHPAFQCSIQADGRPEREDIAKAPDSAWPCSVHNMYRIDANDQRRGFRHELASTLGLFGVLERHDPGHEALLGTWGDWLGALPEDTPANGSDTRGRNHEPSAIEREILDLGADEFDLLAYLVCAHHGKVRVAWHASSADQDIEDAMLRIRGVRQGDILPALSLAAADGSMQTLPAIPLDLSPSEMGLSPRTGRSWNERVLNLVTRFGPFALAWLEALLRAADQRASRLAVADILLQEQEDRNVGRHLDEGRRAVAQSAERGTSPPSSGSDSPTGGELHGHGRRAGGRGVDSGTTRPPHPATRYVETTAGILSYRELAPLLAERVAETELAIYDRTLAPLSTLDLLLDLHRRICGDLTPKIAGRWRIRNVRVGRHQPPPYWDVPTLMQNYAQDVETRLATRDAEFSERLIDDLVFVEGRLLHIHPFADFNGRVSRLFLTELLYRLDLPTTDTAAASEEETRRYFDALRRYDRRDPRPLAAIWRRRLERGLP